MERPRKTLTNRDFAEPREHSIEALLQFCFASQVVLVFAHGGLEYVMERQEINFDDAFC